MADWFTNFLGRRYHVVTYSPLRLVLNEWKPRSPSSAISPTMCSPPKLCAKSQSELAHVNRVTTMGQLTASIAHEVSQPIAAAVTNAQAALRWLNAQQPNIEEVMGRP